MAQAERTNRTPLATDELGRWHLQIKRGLEGESTAPHLDPGEQPFRLASRGSSLEQALDLLRQYVRPFERALGDDAQDGGPPGGALCSSLLEWHEGDASKKSQP
jgi:hypothetical protein